MVWPWCWREVFCCTTWPSSPAQRPLCWPASWSMPRSSISLWFCWQSWSLSSPEVRPQSTSDPPSLEAPYVCHQGLHVLVFEICGGHPSRCHLGSRLLQESSQLFAIKLCPDANQFRGRCRSHSTVTVTGVASLLLEDVFPFSGERIGEGDVGSGQRGSRQLGLERRFHKALDVFMLLCQLGSYRRIAQIVATAEPAQDAQPDENDSIDGHRDRPFPWPAFRPPVEKRECDEQQRDKSRNHQNPCDREGALPILQPLKYWNVIPLRTRHVLRVSRICLRAEFDWGEMSQQAKAADNEQSKNDVEQNLSWIKRLGRLFQGCSIALNWSRGPGLAEQVNVDSHAGEDESRNHEYVEDEETGQR